MPIAYCLLFLSSCGNKNEHKHIPANKTSELDGLVQPANQTVFSEVKTISPIQKTFTPTLYATGVISYDPRLLNTISARYSGRIEKLYVRFNFQSVTKGQRIMDIYSPEILTAQQDYIFLLNNSDVQAQDFAYLLNSSKQKLQLLGLTAEQLKLIETKKQVINPLPVYSSYDGHIHDIGTSAGQEAMSNKQGAMGNSQMGSSSYQSSQVQIENLPSSQTSALTIKEGMYVQSGQSLFSVYNTTQVWAVLNIFPKDAALIKVGDKVSITSETNPDNVIDGTINYIEPVTGQNASAIKARVYLKNVENLHLKIGTILSAKILTHEINGMWLPRKSVVDLGQKQVVFIKGENHFSTKIIQTGIVTDSLVQILSGLNRNEKVADNAQFLVDSESFIRTENK
ncbi:MAG: HlyD family efflux transporter periplasmic adaptor subunit [Bacteroidia bacterium]